ncbi:hypothetical protein AB0L71_20780 [Streptomyces sp. NPDC052052]|uniref:hypothetical protein n=1 Tax=Streptomyces sp. NPDC052052 TaxID=3154756 RepID=UPI003418CCEF
MTLAIERGSWKGGLSPGTGAAEQHVEQCLVARPEGAERGGSPVGDLLGEVWADVATLRFQEEP